MTTPPALIDIVRWYYQTNDKEQIGRTNSRDHESVGPVLSNVFNVLECEELEMRSKVSAIEGGRSGDLYVVHRRLLEFYDEGVFGGESVNGNKRAQVYEVIMNNTNGWAQYISVLLKGNISAETRIKFDNADFAPKHSYLAKNDPVIHLSHRGGVWLDDFADLTQSLPRLSR